MRKVNENVVRDARQAVGRLFRDRRKELGYTQKEVADFCEVTYQTINRFETGDFPYSIDLLFKISVILKMNVFFEEKEEGKTERFLLQESSKKNHYVITDTENGIVCEFEKGRYNETQHFTMLKDEIIPVNRLATIMREFGDYLLQNHPDII